MNLGPLLDTIGTKLGLPEWGLSEKAAGKATQNTNSKPLAGTDAYLALNDDGSFSDAYGGKQQYVQTVNSQPTRDGTELAAEMEAAGWGNATSFDQLPGAKKTQATVPAPAGGTPAPVRPDRTNSINSNMAALGGADQQKTSGLAAIADTLSRIFGGYDTEVAGNEKSYGESSVTNKNNLLRNTQAALVNAAEGRRGLFGILASLGALNGSGVNLANRAVQQGANADIMGGTDTFNENQAGLDTSIAQFRDADRLRREETERAAEAERGALEHQVLTNKQKIYGSLADDYAQMGNEGESKRFADMVAALFPEIGRLSVQTPGLSALGASYNQSPLAKFVGGTPSNTVKTTPAVAPNALPGLVAQPTVRRREDE